VGACDRLVKSPLDTRIHVARKEILLSWPWQKVEFDFDEQENQVFPKYARTFFCHHNARRLRWRGGNTIKQS